MLRLDSSYSRSEVDRGTQHIPDSAAQVNSGAGHSICPDERSTLSGERNAEADRQSPTSVLQTVGRGHSRGTLSSMLTNIVHPTHTSPEASPI